MNKWTDREIVMEYIHCMISTMESMRSSADPYPSDEADEIESELTSYSDVWEDDLWGWAFDPQTINIAKALSRAKEWFYEAES